MKQYQQQINRIFICLLTLIFLITGTPLLSHAGDEEEAKRLNQKLIKLYKEGLYPEAAKIGERVLAIREKSLGPEHPDTATSLNYLALLYYHMGAYSKAEPLYTRALKIREKALGPEHPDTATSLNNLALLYKSMGSYSKAEPLYKRSLAIIEKSLGPEHPSTATSLNNLAGLYRSMGSYSKAEPLYRRALAITEKALGPEHPSTATPLNNLAGLYRSMGSYSKAEPLYKRSLAIIEKSLGPEHPSTATSLNNLAALYESMGSYSKAKPLYKRSLAISEKTLGAEHPFTATSLNNLGALYYRMGSYTKAEPLYRRSLAIREKALGPGHPATAISLNDLAELYHAMGSYSKAEPLYKRSLAIHEKALGPEHPSTAISLNNLAGLYRSMGSYSKAEPLLRRSLAIHEKALGPGHPATATSLNNLAWLYYSIGSYSKAEPLYKRSLAIAEKALGPEHPQTATSLNNLAELYRAMGSYAKAEPLYRRSLAIHEKALGPGHPSTATSLINLAELYRSMGSYARAEPLYKRSLAIREKSLGPGHPHTAQSLNSLAFLYGSQDKNIESLNLFKRGLKIDEQTIQNIFTIAAEEQKLIFVKKISWGYEGALSLIHQKFASDQDALGLGLNLVLSRKGIVFDAQARQIETIANSLDPKVKELWDKLTLNRSNLAKLLQGKPENLSYDEYRSRIKALQNNIEKLEAKLASMSGLVAEELEQRKATAEKVAGRLPKDAVLAEFVRIQDYDWEKGKWADTQRYLAFILHPDQQIKLINLGNAGELDKEVEALLKQIKTIPTDIDDNRGLQISPKTNHTENKAVLSRINASRKLHTLLWQPLDNFVGKTDSIVVSPDGILNLVPFSALQDSNGKFLIENHTITYVTSGRDLLRSGGGVKPESDLFLAADPAFDIVAKAESSDNLTIQRGRFRSAGFKVAFQPLPGTAEEARTIPGLLPGKNKRVLTGAKATESAVLNVKRPRVLHLATHGFFLKDQEQFALIGQRGISVGPKKLPKNYENPLVRSGLAFAGANYAAKAKTSMDGLLTALEVSGMDLHGTDLVTLSACDTGVGEVKAGEGVYGLRRAFALAGARNLLMSLWPISDEITAVQMENFYRLYGKGTSPAKALRAAQLKTIAQLRKKLGSAPPSLWAPFILQGAPAKN